MFLTGFLYFLEEKAKKSIYTQEIRWDPIAVRRTSDVTGGKSAGGFVKRTKT